ncbi:hypothetical protein [Umezawaea tangerina]|uniref:WXG100 family type VII secretion target n=1 Tax=Umezawaea tangerina TaxID=84725 RepID=A0A2T0TD73_9PSEU|nr:hypothetical protein [Umezawaea tangerina]PRY43600.1 hypothetical protein CLV43_103347 [Umezawaea tangerina]
MATPSWEDVKKVVDNPAVSTEDKKALLLAYYTNDVKDDITGTHNDELEEYLDDYDISWGDGQWQATKDAMPWADSSEDRLNSAYDKGKKAADEGDARNAQHEKDKKAGQDVLDGSAQRASDGGAGVANSNQLLDAGKPGLKYFENFLPVYQSALSVIDGGKVDTSVDNMHRRYDEQRDIDFHKIDIDIVELHQVAQDSRDRQGDAEKSMSKLWSGWTGKAADASRKFVTDMSSRAATHAEAVDHIAEVTRAACHTVSGLVNTKARTILEGVRNVNDIAGLSPDQIKQVIDGVFSEDEALLRRVAGFVKFTIDDGACDGDVWKEQVRKESMKWLKGTFKPDVDGKYEQFDAICKSTKESVDKAWEEVGKQVDAFNTKPFDPPKQDAPPKQDNPPAKDHSGTGSTGTSGTGGTGTGGGGTGGGGTGGGGTGGGGGGTPPSTPSIPEMPKPENPLDKNGDGIPDDANGDGKPDDPSGSGGGGGGDGKGEEKKPESVTITSGANEIKVTEPDSRGHVKITVDTPNSPPKTYDLDFSKNPEAAKALMGANGAAAISQALSGQGGAGAGAGAGTTPGSAPSAGGATPVEAGADGKAVIELDGLTITTEIDPLTGEVNISVDDGTGEPQQYGLEFGDDDGSSDPEGTDKSGADRGRPDFSTMPAYDSGPGSTDPAFAQDGGQSLGDRVFEREFGGGQSFGEPAFEREFGGQSFADQGFGGQGFADQGGQSFAEPAQAQQYGGQGFTDSAFAQSFSEQGFTDPGFAQPTPAAGFSEPFAGGFSSSDGGTTSTAGASALGDSSFDRADSMIGPQVPPAAAGPDPMWGPPTPSGDASLADTTAAQAGQPGSATLPSIGDGAGQGQAVPPAGGMMGGGMMGGGQPGGGQQGGSGDSERGASQWRTTGSLFDDEAGLGRLQGVLGEDNAR